MAISDFGYCKTDFRYRKTDKGLLKTDIKPLSIPFCLSIFEPNYCHHINIESIKHRFLYPLFFLLIAIPLTSVAQKEIATFQDFTIEDGLSSTNATIFYQDARGVIWIGTSYGINSYDGTRFKSYTKEDNGLCHNYIHTIAEDGKGNLWIEAGDFGTQDYCFSILDPISEIAYSIEEYTGQPCPFDKSQTRLNTNYKGTFLLKEDKDNDNVQFYEVQQDKIIKGFACVFKNSFASKSSYPANAIKLDSQSYLFSAPKVGFEEGFHHALFRLHSSGKIQENKPLTTAFESVSLETDGQHYYSYVLSFPEGTNQSGHITTYKDGEHIAHTALNLRKEYPPLLIKGNIYQYHDDLIEKYKRIQDSLILDQTIHFNKERILSEKRLFDRSGNLWFHGGNKISKMTLSQKNIQVNLIEKLNVDLSRPIRGIVSKPEGSVYVADYYGLNIKNPIKNTDFKLIKDVLHGGNLGILYDDNKLWIGKEYAGLELFDLKTQNKSFYGEGLIWQPYKSADGTIWAGAGKGLYKLDTVIKDLVPFGHYGDFEELKKSSVYAFYHNEKGTWLSTSSGVYLVDLGREKVLAHYSDTQTGALYIPSNHVAHIYEDQEGIFWLATKGQGLIRWNTVTGKSERLTHKNAGLSHNVIYAVYEDDYDNLWLPSDYGLNCLNKKSRQVSIYLKEDGLPHHEFNTISHHQDKDGTLYFGTVDGMIEFHPKDVNQHGDELPFIISDVHRIDQQTDSLINMTRSVLDNHSLVVKPSDKAVEISFALLDYKKTTGNQYSYKIEGYRDEWIYQKKGQVRISGLPYGAYQLLLRGKASGSNTWVEYSHPIQIKFLKPFYLSWWFLLSVLLTLSGFIYYIIKRNTRVLLERQNELEAIVEERTEEIRLQAEELKALDKVKSKFFANISHELRTPLTLILGPLSYILDNPDEWENKNIQKQLLVMQRNGKSLMDLIEEILDLSKLEANKLELNEEGTPVTQFFERLFFVFEPQFQSQGLSYELNLEVAEGLNVMMDRKKMEKVMNNYLSNAIKFTPQHGNVSLNVKDTDGYLKISVSDTGKGVHPKDLPHIFERFYQSGQADQVLYGGTGIGLALVNEFAQLMNGKAYAESTLGIGSNFFFELPKKEVASQSVLARETVAINTEEIYEIGNEFTLLVVEDNADMREFIYQLLHKKYERVLLAKNGAEGMVLLKEHGINIHLIISDVMMPEVDGLTMLKLIKQNPEWSGIPVVMLTALAAERDKLSALTIGVDDYLTKPFSVPELLIRIQNLLFNYHQRRIWHNSPEYKEQQEEVLAQDVSKVEINVKDKEWVDEVTRIVENAIKDSKLNVDVMASAVFLSKRQLNRKLKAITGLSPAKFIKEVRLQAGLKKLETGSALSVTEVALDVGFENISTFSAVFKNRFGKSPSAYL